MYFVLLLYAHHSHELFLSFHFIMIFLFNVSWFSWILTVENTDVVGAVGLLVGHITEAEALRLFILLSAMPHDSMIY